MTDSPSPSDGRARRLAGWAVVLGGTVGFLLSLASADWHRRTLFDAWQRIAPREIGGENVAVVIIDPSSMRLYGAWPWPRYLLARLTEGIAAQQPKAIGFDMLFAEPDAFAPDRVTKLYPELSPAAADLFLALPDLDAQFADVIGRSPVLLARLGVESDGSDPEQLLVDPEVAGTLPAGTLRYPQVLASIATLDDAALAHGFINGDPDDDGVVRRVPLSILAGKRPMPGFAAELARIASDTPQLEWRGGAMLLGDRRVFADEAGRMQFRMGELPAASRVLASEVLLGQVPKNALTGKIVLLGLSGDGTADLVTTPLGTQFGGVFVQAQAIDALLTGNWLSRPQWVEWAEIAAALLMLVLVLAAARWRAYWQLAIAGGFAVALPIASYAAFSGPNLLFDPVRPIMVGVCASIAMWITLFVHARAERARLAAALVEQRVSAAEQEGELNAARRIQQGMVPGAERLNALDPRAEIGAVLRPARSVGGDFYDALMIGPDTLLFVIGDVTGKGVPAALYMALSKALSKSVLSRVDGDLGDAVAALNRELMAEADEEMGVTVLAGLLDCASGELALVNAGHENPLVVRRDGAVESLPLRGGPPFCVVDFPYPQESAKLAPGETLVLITDGATEAQDAAQALLGLEGVVHALQSEGEMPATTRAADLADRIRAFEAGTEPSDDLTIVTLRFRGR